MAFPLFPTNGQTAVLNNITYIFDVSRQAWTRVPVTVTSTGTQGIQNPYPYILTLTNTTTSISSVTGALQVAGGVGVGGSLAVGNSIIFPDGTQQYTAATNNTGTSNVGNFDFGTILQPVTFTLDLGSI